MEHVCSQLLGRFVDHAWKGAGVLKMISKAFCHTRRERVPDEVRKLARHCT